MAALVTSAALAGSAPAAVAAPASARSRAAAAARPAFSNPGDTSPPLSLSVTSSGQAEAAAVGKGGSLWFYDHAKGSWHRSRLGGAGTAFSGPSLTAGSGGHAYLAVEGPGHSLLYYALRPPRSSVIPLRRTPPTRQARSTSPCRTAATRSAITTRCRTDTGKTM